MRSSWDVEDDQLLAASLDILSVCHTGNAIDAYWSFCVRSTAEDLEKLRRRQIIRLARYARQDIFRWDDIEVIEIDKWMGELSDLLTIEGGADDLRD